MNPLCKLTIILKQSLSQLLRLLLPSKFKRFIILTTIFKKGYDEKIFSNLNFRNLNNRLHIASDVKSMENISSVSSKLWSDVELRELMNTSIHCSLNGECVSFGDGFGLGEQIFNQTPEWLRYDKIRLIQDVSDLFTGEKVYFHIGT